MGKYLKKFDTHGDYEDFVDGGTMVKPNVSYCVQENEVHYNPIPHDYSEDYLTFVALEDGTFTFTPQNSNVISYSTDNGENWTEGNSVEVNNGNKVMWKGTMTPQNYYGIGKFGSTADFNVQGNAMSLLFGDNYKGQTSLTGKNYAFYGLFNGNKKLTNAENLSLPATTLEQYCYSNMFYGCTSLTTAPELSATTLADNCYQSMFNGCTSLTTAPELSVTTLASECYAAMFNGCKSLVNAPTLPSTTLINSCYNGMFRDCTSLVTAPELPAETLAQSCYNNMFRGCTNLNYIKAMFTTTPNTSYTWNWVNGVAANGTFVKNSAATWNVTDYNGVPTGWTVQTATS